MKYLKLFENYQQISDGLKYHINEGLNIFNSIYRTGSDAWINLINESRELHSKGFIELDDIDKWLITTDLGKKGIYEGKEVLLDLPFEYDLNEAEYQGREVELNKPKRGGGIKKYYVYVKNPKSGKVIKVSFGDVHGGQTAKVSDPKARKSFAARHQCHMKKDKTKPGYWACRANRYANLWGGKTYPGYW